VQGQVTVLVVSVDADPTGLNNELTQLGVTVLSSALHDCEELIEDKKPDLVVLLGARGAMELASLIEGSDAPSPPRMVIAADRRELAKMIGLNRDVVVSLFATESGEQVLGQRIESLARRAARRRTASIPPISLKGTTLGLPSASRAASKFSAGEALGKINLKAATVPRPMAASIDEAPPPPALLVSEQREPVMAKLTSHHGSRPREPERPKPPTKTAPGLLPPAADVVTTVPVAARVQAAAAAPVDDDLLSLRPSEFPDADIESIPSLAPDELVSPPTLPPDAKLDSEPLEPGPREAQPVREAPPIRVAMAVEEPSPGTDPPLSDFDVSGAEAALDNLENLLVSASKPAVLADAERPASQEQPPKTESLGQVEPVQELALPFDDLDLAEPQQRAAVAAPGEVALDQEGEAEEQFFSSAPAPPSVETSAARAAHPSAGRGRSVGVWVPIVLVAAAVAGAWYVHRSQVSVAKEDKPGVAAVAPSPAASGPAVLSSGNADQVDAARLAAEEARAAQQGPAADGSAVAAPADTVSPTAARDAAPAASLAEADGAATGQPASTQPPAGAPLAAGAEAAAAAGASAGLAAEAEPFVVTDTRRPSCAAVLGEDVPKPGRDIVHEASTLWAEARKMIVAGRLDDAHKKMCQAVSLNPQSAAVEGLAGFYLDQFSLDEAEQWIKKAEAIRPGQRETQLLLGDIQGLRGNVVAARATWLNALKIPESKASQIRAMSRDYSTAAGRKLVTGDLVKAELWYRRAVVLDEQNLAALMGLANTFMRKNKPRHALSFAYKVLSISELIPEMQVLVGNVAAQAGDKAEARRHYEKALTIRSDFFPAKRGLGELE